MIEPIHIQTNILGTTEQARTAQNVQTELAGTQSAKAEKAAEAHQVDSTTTAQTQPDQSVENPADGSGRGRGWLRQRRKKKKKEEEGKSSTESSEPGKGERVDLKS